MFLNQLVSARCWETCTAAILSLLLTGPHTAVPGRSADQCESKESGTSSSEGRTSSFRSVKHQLMGKEVIKVGGVHLEIINFYEIFFNTL